MSISVKVHKGVIDKKHAIAHKMAKGVDSVTSKNHSKYPKHGGAGKHGSGVSKGLPF